MPPAPSTASMRCPANTEPGRSSSTRPVYSALVAQLSAAPGDELLELGADALVERRLLVALERLAPDAAGPLGRVGAAVALPAVEVLRRGQQRAVEAGAEALQRVRGAEEVP